MKTEHTYRYDAQTGFIIRRSGDGTEKVACYVVRQRKSDYTRRQIRWNGVVTNASRVAWFLVHGVWPDGEIDHIDGDATNNRMENLRCVTHVVNNRNRRRHPNNSSGVTGVQVLGSRYMVRIGIGGGKQKRYGIYDSLEEAAEVARRVHKELGYTERHGL